MSRAYRIRVRETLRRVLRARDHVSTQLELLPILTPEERADLLRAELEQRGFHAEGQVLVRKGKGVTIAVDPAAATVTVQAEATHEATLQSERDALVPEGWVSPRRGKVEQDLREAARQDLEKQAQRQAAQLQGQVTEALEGQLADLRRQLDQVVNRVTAEALKRRAAQLGQIKEMTEDPQTGSLTITLEV
jgi:hypothetical protein